MNKVCLIGRLTKEPDVRYTQTSIAVNRRFIKEGEERQSDFINIVAWNKTGEFVSKYFKKGQQVGIVGRIQTRNYDDENGQKHYITEVIAEEVYFADSKKENIFSDFGVTDSVKGKSDSGNSYSDELPF